MLSFGVNIDTTQSFSLELRRIFFLGILSLLLILMGPTGIFAPIPLVFIFLLYSQSKGIITGMVGFSILLLLTIIFNFTPLLSVVFLLSFVNAILIANTILKGLSPDRGLVMAGIVFFIIVLVGVGSYLAIGPDFVKVELTRVLAGFIDQIKKENADFIAQGGDDARVLQDLLKDPKTIVENFLNWACAAFFSILMFGHWLCLIIVLRSSLVWKKKRAYDFTIRHLISFKAPEFFVWPLIMALGLVLVGEYILGPVGTVLGMNFLYFLGVFYFIQGVGVYYDVLQMVGIRGGFRSILVILAAVMAYRFLAIVGVFDQWINFRQQIKNFKKNKGDNL